MKGLPPQVLPLRVVVQGDAALLEALASDTDRLILSPVETSLEISSRVAQADVILVDVTQQPSALEDIKDLKFDRPVLALVNRDQVRDAFNAGAVGAISRQSAPEAIAAAIGAVHEGLSVLDRSFLSAALPEASTTVKNGGLLTNREREVLALLADGLSNKEIAVRLEISEHTAKFHVNSILQKMGAQKRVEAVVRAAKMGLIEL